MDAMPNLVRIAEDLTDWDLLEKEPKYTVKTRERKRPKNYKKEVVKARKFKTIQTTSGALPVSHELSTINRR